MTDHDAIRTDPQRYVTVRAPRPQPAKPTQPKPSAPSDVLSVVRDVLFLLGCAAVACGLWWLHPAWCLVTCGALMVLASVQAIVRS